VSRESREGREAEQAGEKGVLFFVVVVREIIADNDRKAGIRLTKSHSAKGARPGWRTQFQMEPRVRAYSENEASLSGKSRERTCPPGFIEELLLHVGGTIGFRWAWLVITPTRGVSDFNSGIAQSRYGGAYDGCGIAPAPEHHGRSVGTVRYTEGGDGEEYGPFTVCVLRLAAAQANTRMTRALMQRQWRRKKETKAQEIADQKSAVASRKMMKVLQTNEERFPKGRWQRAGPLAAGGRRSDPLGRR